MTAVWRSWTATSAAKTATVTVGAATHFTITAAPTTPTAGAADNLTITAKDANESTVTTYTGSHSLIFSGASASPGGTAPTVANSSGTAIAFGSATALTFTAGVATVTSQKRRAEALQGGRRRTSSASEGSIDDRPTPLALTVAPAAAAKFTLAAATTTPAAGAADNLTITAAGHLRQHRDRLRRPPQPHLLRRRRPAPAATSPTVTDSTGADVAFGTATTIDFSAGVADASAASATAR